MPETYLSVRREDFKISDGTPNYHLSFSGCGFQGLYHIGVASCIKRHAPYLFNGKVAGCSAGGLIAAASICDCKLEDATQWSLDLVRKARSRTFGPFHPSFDLIGLMRRGVDAFLPQDAHIRCNGKLFLSLTTLPDRKNKIVSHYSSREELINALICTCWIPLFAGLVPPRFEGQRYIDGGFTCNLPLIDDHTITVAPFCGAADISPSDEKHTFNYINVTNLRMELTAENVMRFARIFYPPNTNDVLKDLCKRGYDDAFQYLQTHKLMSCHRCLNSSALLFNLARFPRSKTTAQLKRQLAPSAKILEVAPLLARKRTNSREQIYVGRSFSRLRRNSLSCVSCLSTNSQNQNDDDDSSCENCPECQRIKDEENAILPEQIVTLLQNFTMNQSLYNKICGYKVVQFLGFITLPIRLPLEAMYVTGRKLYHWLPEVSDDFNWFIYTVNSAVKELMDKTGTNLCFARLHLELVNVEEDNCARGSRSRRVSYCSAHSNPASRATSRRSSISFEAIEHKYASSSGSSRSLIELQDSHKDPAADRRMSIDLKFGFQANSGKYEISSIAYPSSSEERRALTVEVRPPTPEKRLGSPNFGYASDDDVIYFSSSVNRTENVFEDESSNSFEMDDSLLSSAVNIDNCESLDDNVSCQ